MLACQCSFAQVRVSSSKWSALVASEAPDLSAQHPKFVNAMRKSHFLLVSLSLDDDAEMCVCLFFFHCAAKCRPVSMITISQLFTESTAKRTLLEGKESDGMGGRGTKQEERQMFDHLEKL